MAPGEKAQTRNVLKSFLVEVLVYGLLVLVYFFLALHFLGSWIDQLYRHNRSLYAAVALALIVAQGIALEVLTTALLRLIAPRIEEED